MNAINRGKKLIAVIGMSGSGKTEVINYLQNKYKWPKVYFGQVVFDEMEKSHLQINPKNEKYMRQKIREKFGMGVCAKLSIPKINDILRNNGVVLIESLYSWEEYKILKNKYGNIFSTVAVYASPAIRFSRLKKRPVRPWKKFQDFMDRDWHEIEYAEKGGPIALADHTIINEGSKAVFQKNIDKVIKKIIE